MAFEFIFMLTSNDRTVPDARHRLKEVLAAGRNPLIGAR